MAAAYINCFLLAVILLCLMESLGGTELQVQLVGGPDRFQGRVEVRRFDNETWGTVCDDGWNSRATSVVCRQLGFSNRGKVKMFGEGSGPIYLDEVDCHGGEPNLGHCSYSDFGVHDCDHTEDVGVDCLPDELQVQLVGGPDRFQGRVEVRRYDNETWGTVCDDIWNSRATSVVCRQLGFSNGGKVKIFGEGSGPIYLDEVDCHGGEPNLGHCSYSDFGVHDCDHTEDVGVNCLPDELQVQLVGGPDRFQGRVEVRRFDNETWGTVCNDGWNSRATSVVCRQLGFSNGGKVKMFGEGSGPIYLDEFFCLGEEPNLGHCSYPGWGVHDCNHTEDVGVICLPDELQVQLVGGPDRFQGRVEVRRFDNETWGTVCDDGWNSRATSVVCRQLGFSNRGKVKMFGEGSGPIYLDEFFCLGEEPTLRHCSYFDWGVHDCDHTEDVGVICLPDELKVQLVGGPDRFQGRLEVRRNDNEIWGTVCSDYWNSRATSVVCRQLGFSNGGKAVLHSRMFGEGKGPIYLDDVYCLGEEPNLGHCSYFDWGDDNCDHTKDVGVICLPDELQVQLVGGPDRFQGRVEVRRNDNETWGKVCDNNWSNEIASVVCRQLGFSNGGKAVLHTRMFGEGSGPIYLDDVYCQGEEPNLGHCTYPGWGVHNCNHTEDVGVICLPDGPHMVGLLTDSEVTGALRNISKLPVNDETVNTVVTRTKDVVSKAGNASALDVIKIADILHTATQLQTIPKEAAREILEIVDEVGDFNEMALDQSLSAGNATNRMMLAVEDLGDKIPLDDAVSVQLRTNSTVLQVWNLTRTSESGLIGMVLTQDKGEVHEFNGTGSAAKGHPDPRKHATTDTAIMLPGNVGRTILEENVGKDVRVSATIFEKTSLFQVGRRQTTGKNKSAMVAGTLISRVVSMRITVDGEPVKRLERYENGTVTTVFQPVDLPEGFTTHMQERTKCVFWDFLLDEGRGAWSQAGCHLSDIISGKVFCVCDHLTHFAVLMDFFGLGEKKQVPSIHKEIQNQIFNIGLSLSIAGLSVTIISFLLIKKLHSIRFQQILFNLALSMLFTWSIFLAGSGADSRGSCIAVAVLIHYSFLVSFLWMLIQGVLQFILLVTVRVKTLHNFLLKTVFMAWGVPVILVIIILATDVDLYHGGDDYCWMSRTLFYYAFLAPVCLIVVTYTIIYVIVVYSICRRKNMVRGGPKYTTIGFRASLGCFVLLGPTYLSAIANTHLVFQYVYCVVSSLQGFFIFALFTARNRDVRAFWMDMLFSHWRSRRHSSSVERPTPSNMRTAGTAETSFNRRKKSQEECNDGEDTEEESKAERKKENRPLQSPRLSY